MATPPNDHPQSTHTHPNAGKVSLDVVVVDVFYPAGRKNDNDAPGICININWENENQLILARTEWKNLRGRRGKIMQCGAGKEKKENCRGAT